MKKYEKRIVLFLTIIVILCAAVPVFAENTYINGFEGEYFNSIPDDPRTWFGHKLNIYSITDTEMDFDFQYEKSGRAVTFTAEKAVFTDSCTTVAKGTSGYAGSSSFPVTYNFTFKNNHILLNVTDNSSGEEMYNLDFYSDTGRVSENIKVLVDNKELYFEQQPIIVNDRTLVPLRAIMESLGASVNWNGENKTITSVKGDTTVKLTIGSDVMYVNDSSVKIDAAAQIVNGYTLVPVRAISQAYNTKVDWDGNTKTVYISTSSEQPVIPISYDDISSEVNSINLMMGQGLYIEVMQKCEQVKTQYNLSPSDISLLDDLYNSANNSYNAYLEEQSKITFDRATQILAGQFDEVYRSDFIFNLISEDDNYYHIRTLWHNSATGSNNLWGDYKVNKKTGKVTEE